ncbi:MAG: ABC transporter ATP-binding protein [Lysobacteraceae bacterium]
MSNVSVSLDGVSVSFPIGRRAGGRCFTALHDISLSVERGQKLGVIGRNGSGKSTLLRLIAGTIHPDGGQITRNHGACQLLSLGLGFVPHLNGRDNAILSALYQGVSYRRILDRIDAIREFSELGEFFDQPINTYSSGMRARLGISVALQMEPDILLLDEVLGVGDPAFREKSRNAIRSRLRSDATVVLVSHDEKTITDFCPRVAWLDGGRIVACGETEEVLREYSDAGKSMVATRAEKSPRAEGIAQPGAKLGRSAK